MAFQLQILTFVIIAGCHYSKHILFHTSILAKRGFIEQQGNVKSGRERVQFKTELGSIGEERNFTFKEPQYSGGALIEM